MTSLEDRFWAKVQKTDTCWLWTAAENGYGYGVINARGRVSLAHRLSYEWVVGDIPPGQEIDHICRVKDCVNPAHLRAVTSKQNKENHGGARTDSKSGVRGVTWSKRRQKWEVNVGHNHRRIHLGWYEDLDRASAVVREARNQLFTHNDIDR